MDAFRQYNRTRQASRSFPRSGVLSGDALARISLAAGWQGAFVVLGAVTAFSTLAAAFFSVLQRRPATPATDSLIAS